MPSPVAVRYAVFLPQTGHQLRNPLAVGLGQEGSIFVTLVVAGRQLGKFFFAEKA